MEGTVRSMDMEIVDQRQLEANLYRVTIAANEKVRRPPDLDFGSLSVDNYTKNPVVMWAHDTVGHSPSGGLPIGRTLNLTRSPQGRIVADFQFLDDDSFAQRVKNAWDKGFLRAASISWVPLETTPRKGGGWRDTRSDMLEWSIVSVPADPEALREAHRRMVNAYLEGSDEGASRPRATAGPKAGGSGSTWPRAAPGAEDTQGLARVRALLEEAIDSLGASGHAGSEVSEEDPEGGMADDELAEIGRLTRAIKETVANCKEESQR